MIQPGKSYLIRRPLLRLAAFLAILAVASGADVIPAPKYIEPLDDAVRFARETPIAVWVSQPALQPAMDLLAKAAPQAKFVKGTSDSGVILWDYSASTNARAPLNFLDRQLLTESPLRAQSYVVRTDGRSVWVIGGGPPGVLYGAATVAQLLRPAGDAIETPGVYIRDYPDFEFRAASDWLLSCEVNRWALDRGQGLEAYGQLVKRRLDRAAQYKINVALIDGFGWSLDKRPAGYAPLMRDLNRYARTLGIHLQYGGYGAAYDIAQRPNEYQGDVFLNRESYPDGPVYKCMSYPEHKGGIDPRTMGSCRSNEALNRLKAENLAHFVSEVEPGTLYIHHEDCCVFEDYQKAWLGRCDRCRRQWPNDSLLAPDGGAGALAHGYSALIDAVNRVRRPDSGYAAARDTQITLVSPVYMPANTQSSEWGNVLELWRIITRLLPKAENVQICFREVLPQPGGGERWVKLFNSVMLAEKLPFGASVFVVGGADNFLTDYPTSGIPAMNAFFRGARTIYNATGDFYREPMEVLAAAYSWNTQSDGFFRDPANAAEMTGLDRWIYTPATPPEIYGPGKLFDRICARLYGTRAGASMSDYYRLTKWLPESEAQPTGTGEPFYRGRKSLYLPFAWNYVTAVPMYWYHLLEDSATWGAVPDPRYQSSMKTYGLSVEEIHRRLARRWSMAAELNAAGLERVKAALGADPNADTVEDLRFLISLFDVDQPLVESLRDYHTARANSTSPKNAALLASARAGADTAAALAAKYFPRPVDPAMGEIGSLRTYPQKLSSAIEAWEKSK